MHILLDSTEYRQDRGLNKEQISLLRELGNKRLISIHIPWFVYKESSSTSFEELKSEFNNISTKLINADKKGIHEKEYGKLKKIVSEINGINDVLEKSVENVWQDFIKHSNSIFHEFDKDDSFEVFQNYFKGDKPFKNVKNREDIPDAFIYLTIKKISLKEKLILISNDNNLVEKCSDLKNIETFNSLKELYDTKDFKEIISNYQMIVDEKEKFENAKEIILSQTDIIESSIFEFCNTISYLEFEDKSLKSDNHDATLYGFHPDEIKIKEREIKHIGNEIFVPVEILGFGLIDYYIFKADYWSYQDLPKYSEDWNDHYFRMEEEVKLKMIKNLKFRISSVLRDYKEDYELEVDINDFDTLKII